MQIAMALFYFVYKLFQLNRLVQYAVFKNDMENFLYVTRHWQVGKCVSFTNLKNL